MDLGAVSWILIFGALGWIGLARGWTWVVILSVFCLGAYGGRTEAGSAIVGGITGVLNAFWTAMISALNSVAH